MAAPAVLAFVSGPPSTTPTITFSLNQPGLVKVLGDSFSLGGPDYLGDPDGVGAGYGKRQVEFTLQFTGDYDEVATAIQSVIRQITQQSPTGPTRRNWLMFRWSGEEDHPFFLRTYPTSLSAVNWRQSGAGVWEMPVQIMCDEAFWGAPESGSVTVNNDPVAGTNPCFWRIGTGVKGDIETPLFITTGAASDLFGRSVLVASQALGFSQSQTAPFYTQFNVASGVSASPGSGVAWTTGSGDAAMSGGNYWRLTTSSTAGDVAQLLWNSNTVMANAPVGDYRVLIRTRASDSSDWLIQFVLLGGSTSNRVNGDVITYHQVGTGPKWLDLGVFRLPPGAPPIDTGFGTAATSAGVRPELFITAPAATSKTLDLDGIMFVPAGVDQAVATRTGMSSVPVSGSGSLSLVLDSLADFVYMLDSGGQVGYTPVPSFVGSLPSVVPGADNSLTYLWHVGITTTTNDSITASTVLNWKYWPRYLHLRTATT